MTGLRNALSRDFGEADDSPVFYPSALTYASSVLDSILSGKKPFLDPDNKTDAWIIDLFRLMEEKDLIPENWEQFVISPGQDASEGMALGVTSMSVFCAPLLKSGEAWEKKLRDAGFENFHVLGLDPAFRFYGQKVDQAAVAHCFVLPEGDFDAFSQFLKIVHHNHHFSSVPRPIVVDNRTGFWTRLKEQCPENQWAHFGVSFVHDEEHAIRFFEAHVDPENRMLKPLQVEHPFSFGEKNPVVLLGTGNPEKVWEFEAIKKARAPLLPYSQFHLAVNRFEEPLEESLTYLGNAIEKREAMLDVIYRDEDTYQKLKAQYPDRPIVLVANDTGARLRLIDQDGQVEPIDWYSQPELQKAQRYIAKGKERWYPGAEVKMVAGAMGNSALFYPEVLRAICERKSKETGKDLHIEYVDDSLCLYTVLGESRDDAKTFAVKGSSIDDMVFQASPDSGDISYKNYCVPREKNPQRRTRADLGAQTLLVDSAFVKSFAPFLELMHFPEPLSVEQAFTARNARIYSLRKSPKNVVGTIGDFCDANRGSGFADFTRLTNSTGFIRPGKISDLNDISGFESYLESIDALLLGGADDIYLPPVHRAAFYSRVMVAIQTRHSSLDGKPVVIVNDDSIDPVLQWVMKTQNFLYNNKLFGAKLDQCVLLADGVRSGLNAARKYLVDYRDPPAPKAYGYVQDGEEDPYRPSVSLLASASTYDPQHLEQGEIFGAGLAQRDLHFRHGGCFEGVIGRAADSFATYRDQHGKGFMTGIQCTHVMAQEGMNSGNDCSKIYTPIGDRKLDIYRSDILVFMAGGWGTVEELFDLLTMIDAGKIDPRKIIIVDYPFDLTMDGDGKETTFQYMHKFPYLAELLRYGVKFVSSAEEALKVIDCYVPSLWTEYEAKRSRDQAEQHEVLQFQAA